MSCLTTSATRRSRIVPAAVLIASAAASSQELLLVPMISVTLYTLMTLSLEPRADYSRLLGPACHGPALPGRRYQRPSVPLRAAAASSPGTAVSALQPCRRGSLRRHHARSSASSGAVPRHVFEETGAVLEASGPLKVGDWLDITTVTAGPDSMRRLPPGSCGGSPVLLATGCQSGSGHAPDTLRVFRWFQLGETRTPMGGRGFRRRVAAGTPADSVRESPVVAWGPGSGALPAASRRPPRSFRPTSAPLPRRTHLRRRSRRGAPWTR